MALRRVVRATPDFFEDLDRQLGRKRGLNGEPSATDFQALDLLRLVERFATEFDTMPELIAGRPDYRVHVTTGRPATSLPDSWWSRNSPAMEQSSWSNWTSTSARLGLTAAPANSR